MYDSNLHEESRPATHYEYVLPVNQYFVATPDIKAEAFNYMQQLDGWCSAEKASVLIDLIQKTRPEKIVEIGVWGGKSLVPMACALRANGFGKVFGIDPWNSASSLEEVMNESNRAYWGTVDHEFVYRHLIEKIQA